MSDLGVVLDCECACDEGEAAFEREVHEGGLLLKLFSHLALDLRGERLQLLHLPQPAVAAQLLRLYRHTSSTKNVLAAADAG